MARRTGVPTLIRVAELLCKYIVQFAPIIQVAYPSNPALQLALTAALTACQALEEQLIEVREAGQ